MSLRVKVNLFFATLLLVSLLVSMGVLITNARHSVKADMEETMSAAAQLITVSLSGGRSLDREGGMYQHLHDLVIALSEIRSLHILLFDNEGLLFEGEPKKGETISPPEWFIDLLLPKVTPLTKRFGQGHMVIYAAPLQEIEERPSCPGCSRSVKAGWIVCPHCHTRLRKKCPDCDELMELQWNLCPFCGNQHVDAYQAAAIPTSSIETNEEET